MTTKVNSAARKQRAPGAPLAYSVSEAARVTGLGRSTLYPLMAEGVLPFAKVGGRRLILADDLKRFLERHRVAA